MSEAKPGSAVGGGRFVTNGELDAVTAELAELVRRTGLTRTLAIGEVILTRFFAGQPEAWRVRRRNKRNSIRRLAERPGCPLSRSALNQAVGVYVTVQALPCVRTFGHIDASHVAAVLPLRPDDQERWLTRADGEQWSVRRLKEAITGERRSAGERRGRPSISEAEKALTTIGGALQAIEGAVATLCQLVTQTTDLGGLDLLIARMRRLDAQLIGLQRHDDDKDDDRGLASPLSSDTHSTRSILSSGK